MQVESGGSSDGQPKYALVYQRLRDKLGSGRFPVGSRLPTEKQMSYEFEVSRITVRRALEQLIVEGYLSRRQGSGYSVVALSPQQQNCLSSFTDAVYRSGATPTSRLLSLRELDPKDEAAKHLPHEMHEQGVLLQIRRLRCIDEKPAMLVSTWLAKSAVGPIGTHDFPERGFEQSILRILQDKFRLSWETACEEISPVVADTDAAELLGIARGVPILRQACSAFATNGSMVFYEDLLRAGSITFESYALRRQINDVPSHGRGGNG